MSELLTNAAAIAASESGSGSDGPTGISQAPASRARRIARTAGWGLFALFLLLFFTFLKLPEDRLKNFIEGNLNAALSPKGISFSAGKGYLSLGLGISYVMKDVTLTLPPPSPPAHLDKVSVSPSIFPMLLGRMGGSASIVSGDGSLDASFAMRKSDVSLSLKARGFDLGKTGILPAAAGVQGGAVISGKLSLSGDMNIPTTLDGNVDLELSKIALEPQAIMGFAIPKVYVSEGKIELSADKGKATIQEIRLGKSAQDDVRAKLSGDVTLGKQWESSTINARASFSLSENIMRSFVLLDALLGGAKQSDGSYAFTLNGPITSPNPTPVGGH